MKIAHLADIQIRFGSRHNEYRTVFKKLHEDLAKIKPDRIVVDGDINHHKINISPGSFELFSELLIGLARIAPTDIIIGNHDLNLQQLEQGDSISPIFTLSKLIEQGSSEKIAYTVNEDNKDSLDFNKKAIYYFPDSGFYRVAKDLVYGVYSMKDNKILTLEKKEPGVNYIALYHGQIYGARGDNGHIINGDNLVKISTFNNFDIVMLGDIHEYQTFREDESMAYCGSLIQQNYGESIDKGYLLWDIEKRSHERKYIPNDFGFAKITIAKGEKFEERIEHIKFSSNKKKTKVYVVWEDYEENFSQEKENQIVKLVKDRHGCEVVKVQFETIIKDLIVTEGEEEIFKASEEYLKEFIENGSYNCSKEELKDLVALHRETNTILEISENDNVSSDWQLNKIEISNVFSFPVKSTTIDLDRLGGITGVFGKNYNGKSNFIKALVWGFYKEILGGGNPTFITNIYTDSNKGYVKIWITIDGKKYYIERTVKTTRKKDGTSSNSYGVIYKTLEFEYDDEGNLDNEKWDNEKSDEKTAEKNEVSNLIERAIGTFDDFTKSSLQTQGGKDDYLSMSQQPKNTLISKYMGLEAYNLRYDYRNDFFKDIKKKQKELGDKVEIEQKIKDLVLSKDEKTKDYDNTSSEKKKASDNRDKTDGEILELTKKLEKREEYELIEGDCDEISSQIENYKNKISSNSGKASTLELWLTTNFKKELPFDSSVSVSDLNSDLSNEKESFSKDKEEFLTLEEWLKINPEKKAIKTDGLDSEVDELKLKISQLEGLLETFKGKKCPTCEHVHEKANPHKEEECLEEIKIKKSLLVHKQEKIKEGNAIDVHNTKVQNTETKKNNLKQSLLNRKEKMDSIKAKIDLINKSQDIIDHNNKVESEYKKLTFLKKEIENDTKFKGIAELNLVKTKNSIEKNEQIKKRNEEKEKNNKVVQEKIDSLTELSKAYKLSVFSLDKQATGLFGEIKVLENNIQNYSQKLIDITEYEQLYRKYSIYLQAMHRDGIPALIIRKKLPLINHRVNTILQQAVDFKINMDILANGDIIESFYFSDSKSDLLPLSFASGSQKFVSMIAIKDALHYISSLPKPSLCIIDEGFGTLDDELTFEIMNILNYLKNKHKNVIVITHRNEIKDFADNIIEVMKVTTGISQEVLDHNPKAGVTKLNVI